MGFGPSWVQDGPLLPCRQFDESQDGSRATEPAVSGGTPPTGPRRCHGRLFVLSDAAICSICSGVVPPWRRDRRGPPRSWPVPQRANRLRHDRTVIGVTPTAAAIWELATPPAAINATVARAPADAPRSGAGQRPQRLALTGGSHHGAGGSGMSTGLPVERRDVCADITSAAATGSIGAGGAQNCPARAPEDRQV